MKKKKNTGTRHRRWIRDPLTNESMVTALERDGGYMPRADRIARQIHALVLDRLPRSRLPYVVWAVALRRAAWMLLTHEGRQPRREMEPRVSTLVHKDLDG